MLLCGPQGHWALPRIAVRDLFKSAQSIISLPCLKPLSSFPLFSQLKVHSLALASRALRVTAADPSRGSCHACSHPTCCGHTGLSAGPYWWVPHSHPRAVCAHAVLLPGCAPPFTWANAIHSFSALSSEQLSST